MPAGSRQVLQPSATCSRSSSVYGGAGSDGRMTTRPDTGSPLQPPTPQQAADAPAPGAEEEDNPNQQLPTQQQGAQPGSAPQEQPGAPLVEGRGAAGAAEAAAGDCCGSPVRPAAARLPVVAPQSPGTDPISEQVRA